MDFPDSMSMQDIASTINNTIIPQWKASQVKVNKPQPNFNSQQAPGGVPATNVNQGLNPLGETFVQALAFLTGRPDVMPPTTPSQAVAQRILDVVGSPLRSPGAAAVTLGLADPITAPFALGALLGTSAHSLGQSLGSEFAGPVKAGFPLPYPSVTPGLTPIQHAQNLSDIGLSAAGVLAPVAPIVARDVTDLGRVMIGGRPADVLSSQQARNIRLGPSSRSGVPDVLQPVIVPSDKNDANINPQQKVPATLPSQEVPNEKVTLPAPQSPQAQPQVAEASGIAPEVQNAKLHDFARDLVRVQAQAALKGQLVQFGQDVRPAIEHQLSMRARMGQLTEEDFNKSDQLVQQLRNKYASTKPGPTGLSQREVRTPVGQGAPLRQQGEVAGVQEQEQEQGQKGPQEGQGGESVPGKAATSGPLPQEVPGGRGVNAPGNGGRGVQSVRSEDIASRQGQEKARTQAGAVFPRWGDYRDETRAAWMDRSGQTKWFDASKEIHADQLKPGQTVESELSKGNLRLNVYGKDLVFEGQPNDKQMAELHNLAIEMDKPLKSSNGRLVFQPSDRRTEAGAIFPSFGPSRRALEQRGEAPEPGEWTNVGEALNRGRELIASGVDPRKVLQRFLADPEKNVSEDMLGVLYAHGANLAHETDLAADKYGIGSPEYERAKKTERDWVIESRPPATAAGRTLLALQGHAEVDTTSPSSMVRALEKGTGKPATEQQVTKIKEHASANQVAEKEVVEKKGLFFSALDWLLAKFRKGQGQDVPPRTGESGAWFPGKNGPLDDARAAIATRRANEAAAIWDYAKEAYLNNPKYRGSFTQLVNQLSIDLGVSKKQIVEALYKPAGIKELSDAMYRALDNRRRVKEAAEAWLHEQKIPGWARFVRSIPPLFFMDKIFGHGGVLPTTHAAVNIFHPERTMIWLRSFMQGWKMAYSSVNHEKWVEEQVSKPNYIMWKRAGLAVDPERYYEDYQNAMMQGMWAKMNLLTGKYGADSLKDLRIDLANHIWDNAPATLKTKDGKVNREFALAISTLVNHASGVVKGKLPEAYNWAFFAPRLEMARWAWLIGDNAKMVNTVVNWKNATPEEKWLASAKTKEMAWIVGTYSGLLALNQGLLKATGSQQNININNPRRADFMAFKMAGHNVGIVGPVIGIVRLLATLIQDSVRSQTKLQQAGLASRRSDMEESVAGYGTKKFSPLMGSMYDLFSQQDYRGRPLPWSNDEPPPELRRAGIGKYGYGEYAASQFLPIPIEEGIKEVWMSQGMTKDMADRLWLGLLSGAAAFTTGARVEPDLPPTQHDQHKEPFEIRLPRSKQFSQGQIIQRQGNSYVVTGFDEDGMPLVEEVSSHS
ncbi:MAG: hypothetical protein KGL39_08665 [Patescibacteria group bacterium]|nr:hypothetical protein [Patescibacteria group bacterium]